MVVVAGENPKEPQARSLKNECSRDRLSDKGSCARRGGLGIIVDMDGMGMC